LSDRSIGAGGAPAAIGVPLGKDPRRGYSLCRAMSIRPVRPDDMDVWLEMRAQLWPETPFAEHRREAQAILSGKGDTAVFLAVSAAGELVGFIEVSLRPCAEGCRTSPVGYVEGWYVNPGFRRQGRGRALMTAAEDWARERGCREMASDTEAANRMSQNVHRRLGYDVVANLVTFRKAL
jgi:aminoglycoside 6'-N-acetyltransferase I